MIAIAIASIVLGIAGAAFGRWIVRRFLGLFDAPSGRQLARDVLDATADRRVTKAERDRLRADAQALLDVSNRPAKELAPFGPGSIVTLDADGNRQEWPVYPKSK